MSARTVRSRMVMRSTRPSTQAPSPSDPSLPRGFHSYLDRLQPAPTGFNRGEVPRTQQSVRLKTSHAHGPRREEVEWAKAGSDNDDRDEGPETIAYPSMIYKDLIWTLPSEVRSAMKSDPTYFHGRDGIACQWTPPSAVSSQNESMVAVFTKIQKEQQLQEAFDDSE